MHARNKEAEPGMKIPDEGIGNSELLALSWNFFPNSRHARDQSFRITRENKSEYSTRSRRANKQK
jgi:hypothetical protein